MATRFYLIGWVNATTVPDVTPPFDAMWEQTGNAVRRWMTPSTLGKHGGSDTVSPTLTISSTDDHLAFQFISEPLDAVLIQGTFGIAMRGIESDIGANVSLGVVARVMGGDDTVRGTLCTIDPGDVEFVTGYESRMVTGVAITPVVAQAGDRLVVEVGGVVSTVTAPSPTFGINVQAGANGNDYTISGDAVARNTWIEFSQDLWYTPINRSVRPAMFAPGIAR